MTTLYVYEDLSKRPFQPLMVRNESEFKELLDAIVRRNKFTGKIVWCGDENLENVWAYVMPDGTLAVFHDEEKNYATQ